MNYPVTLNLSEPLYQSFKERSQKTHRSIEEELLNAVALQLPSLPKIDVNGLPAYDEVLNFLLSSPTPFQVAHFKFSPETVSRAMSLLEKQRSPHGTTVDEERELDAYVELGDFMDVLRARAMLQIETSK